MSSCVIPDCGRPSVCRSMCGRHYQRVRTHGTPHLPVRSLAARFWIKVDKRGPIPSHRPELGPCWLWTAATFRNGYGCITVDGRRVIAHRLAHELALGPIPDGLEIDHLCRVRNCVNPEHLDPVTHAENNRRAAAARREKSAS